MFSIEKIKNGPNPAIPQWRVADQDRSLTLSVKILKSNARAWNLYAERWGQNKWTLIERIGETKEQAPALPPAREARNPRPGGRPGGGFLAVLVTRALEVEAGAGRAEHPPGCW